MAANRVVLERLKKQIIDIALYEMPSIDLEHRIMKIISTNLSDIGYNALVDMKIPHECRVKIAFVDGGTYEFKITP